MRNLRADVESERSTVEELRGMMVAMREEMASLQVHNVEQFASQLQAIESKNDVLSRNMEQVIAYENEFSEFARNKFASIGEVCGDIIGRIRQCRGYDLTRPHLVLFSGSQPVPPDILEARDI